MHPCLAAGSKEMLAVESARQPQYRWSGRTILPLAATAALILVLLTLGSLIQGFPISQLMQK